jgi:hypothetical protein
MVCAESGEGHEQDGERLVQGANPLAATASSDPAMAVGPSLTLGTGGPLPVAAAAASLLPVNANAFCVR